MVWEGWERPGGRPCNCFHNLVDQNEQGSWPTRNSSAVSCPAPCVLVAVQFTPTGFMSTCSNTLRTTGLYGTEGTSWHMTIPYLTLNCFLTMTMNRRRIGLRDSTRTPVTSILKSAGFIIWIAGGRVHLSRGNRCGQGQSKGGNSKKLFQGSSPF